MDEKPSTHKTSTEIEELLSDPETLSGGFSPINKGFSVEDYEEHLMERDVELRDYMKLQPFINTKMRKILVNWMFIVHNRFLLKPETYFLAVRILDTFSNATKIGRTKYQLVALASLYMSAKSVEIMEKYPHVKRFVSIANNEYTISQVLSMEKMILQRLNYNFNIPTIFQFLMMYAKTWGFNNTQVSYSLYLGWMATYIYKLAIIKQRDVALTCIYMTMKKFKLWPQIVDKYYIKGIYDIIVSERSRIIGLIDKDLSEIQNEDVGMFLLSVFSSDIYRQASLFDLDKNPRKKIYNSDERKKFNALVKNKLKFIEDIVISPYHLLTKLNEDIAIIKKQGITGTVDESVNRLIDQYELAQKLRRIKKTETGPQWIVNFQKHGYFENLTPEADTQLPISIIKTPPMREFENPYTPKAPETKSPFYPVLRLEPERFLSASPISPELPPLKTPKGLTLKLSTLSLAPLKLTTSSKLVLKLSPTLMIGSPDSEVFLPSPIPSPRIK